MFANPEKFQVIVGKRNSQLLDTYALYIDREIINSEKRVKLLQIIVNNKLNFDERISSLCKKVSNQLNVFVCVRGKWVSRKMKY